MELALQVVGLKMTGKIEDAKNVAMRIVGGNTGGDISDSRGSSSNHMQLCSSPAGSITLNRDLRSLLFIRAGETENFENAVVDFLSILDTPLEFGVAPDAIPTTDAISHPTTTGQTLLHLAAFMKFPTLVNFLVERGADIDARDKNGFTPLHFAVLSSTEECIRILVQAGADREIVNSMGKTAEEIASPGFFDNVLPRFSPPFGEVCYEESDGSRDGDVESEVDRDEEDEEAEWGDAEEEEEGDGGEDEVRIRRLLRRRASKRAMRRSAAASNNVSERGTPRRSVDISRAPTPPPPSPFSEKKSETSSKPDDLTIEAPPPNEKSAVDVKQTASFVEVIQRTLSQLPPATGIIPNIPYLPKPQFPGFPNLPDFGGMPWGALPQIPMVFPVFVPTPAWPSFLGGSDESGSEKGGVKDEKRSKEGTEGAENKTPNAREWRAIWEKWLALAIATTAKQGQVQAVDDVPPPEYTPRAEDVLVNVGIHKGKGKAKAPASSPSTSAATVDASQQTEMEITREAPVVTSTAGSSRSHSHPMGYDNTPIPAEEVNAYTYQPPVKQKQKHKKCAFSFSYIVRRCS